VVSSPPSPLEDRLALGAGKLGEGSRLQGGTATSSRRRSRARSRVDRVDEEPETSREKYVAFASFASRAC
jgi:hypothetical protein